MRLINAQVLFVILLGMLSTSFVASAEEGPAINTLVPIDQSKYDIDKKESVEKSDVLNRLTKETYFREIFKVNEKAPAPKTATVVLESRSQEVYVRVNPTQQPAKVPGWAYQNR